MSWGLRRGSSLSFSIVRIQRSLLLSAADAFGVQFSEGEIRMSRALKAVSIPPKDIVDRGAGKRPHDSVGILVSRHLQYP